MHLDEIEPFIVTRDPEHETTITDDRDESYQRQKETDRGVASWVSRSVFACRRGHAPIGEVNPSSILHPRQGITLVFIDPEEKIATYRCPACGKTMVYRGGRVALDAQRRTA